MTNLYRLESATEIGDHVAVALVNQNGATSLHMFTAEAWERYRVGEAVLQAWRPPGHERVGPLAPVLQQHVEMTVARHVERTP
jgi:hypothetical protein